MTTRRPSPVTTPKLDLDALRALAEASGTHPLRKCTCPCCAAFVDALSPDVVLALINELRAARLVCEAATITRAPTTPHGAYWIACAICNAAVYCDVPGVQPNHHDGCALSAWRKAGGR